VQNLEPIRIGIDAINIRDGGGITHLKEILSNADPSLDNFNEVILWSSKETLLNIEHKPWLKKKTVSANSFLSRTLWQIFKLSKELIDSSCDILFVPGGSFTTSFKPVLTMNHSLLPFQSKEILRYGISIKTIKFFLLRLTQISSFRRSNGIIFLTHNSRKIVLKKIVNYKVLNQVINHGTNKSFFCEPGLKKDINFYNNENRFKIINVSAIEPYKHHSKLIEAIKLIHDEGYPISFEIYGSGDKKSIRKLIKDINTNDPQSEYIFYKGLVRYEELSKAYSASDLFLFSSTCESFGQTLTEAMASGLPVACSNKSSAPELLASSGLYFDPHNTAEIAKTVRQFLDSKELRKSLSKSSYLRASSFSWYDCTRLTFKFMRKVHKNYNENA